MGVGRLRPRAAHRRRSARSVVLAIGLAALASGCGLVEEAIGPSDETDTTLETTTTTVPVFDPDTYCSLSHQADDLNAAFTAFDDPVALEGFFTDLTDLLNQATPPPEIEAQFVTLRRAYIDLDAELAASQYDPAVLGSSPILSDANVNAAISAVDAHDLELCGPSPNAAPPEEATDQTSDGTDDGTDGTDDGTDESDDPFERALATGDFSEMEEVLGTEVGRQAFIDGLTGASPNITAEQAGCILDNSEMSVLAEMSVDPANLSDEAVASFLATLEVCEIPLSAFG